MFARPPIFFSHSCLINDNIVEKVLSRETTVSHTLFPHDIMYNTVTAREDPVMKIERLSQDKIRIFLTYDDLTERGIKKRTCGGKFLKSTSCSAK